MDAADLDSIDAQIAEADLGEQARAFMSGDLYRVMVGIANQEADAAGISLASVDPTNAKEIMRLQNVIRFGTAFQEWLDGLVSDGDNALAALHQDMEQRRVA